MVRFCKRELDRLTGSVRAKLVKATKAQEIVDAFRETIHEEGGYRYTDRVDAQGIPIDPAELFLHGMLKSKRGYCMNLSLLSGQNGSMKIARIIRALKFRYSATASANIPGVFPPVLA